MLTSYFNVKTEMFIPAYCRNNEDRQKFEKIDLTVTSTIEFTSLLRRVDDEEKSRYK